MIQLGDDIVSAAKDYVASQGFANVDYVPDRQMLVVKGDAGVTHFIGLTQMKERWADADQVARRKLLERRLLALRRPKQLSDDVLAGRLLPRIRPLDYLESLALHRRIIERVDQEPAPEITLPYQPLNEELGVHLVFELSEEAADVNDARVASWRRTTEELLRLAAAHLEARSTQPMREIKPRLWASTVGDGHDAARIILSKRLDALPIQGEMVVMAPHFDLLLACSADDTSALAEMAKFGLQASQQPFGLPGIAMLRTPQGLKAWLPSPDSPVYDALRTARLPGASRAYGRQKELLEAWFDLEGENTLVAPLIVLEEGDNLFSGAVWLKGTTSLLPQADRIAFAIPDQGDNARLFPVPWDDAVKLGGIRMELVTDVSPRRYKVSGFPDQEELKRAASRVSLG